MKNNLFRILSLNIYEKNSNNFSSLKKVQKQPSKRKILENQKTLLKKIKRKKENRKQKNSLYSKKNWARANGPRSILLRSRAERTKARPRAEHRNCRSTRRRGGCVARPG
jgi:hypothetical protein